MTDFERWAGHDAYDGNGKKIGTIEAVYEDETTHQPEWVTVKTGFFGSHVSFVPLAGAERQEDHLILAWDKDTVKDAPHIDPEQHLSDEEEARLYDYYGMRGNAGMRTGTTTARAPARPPRRAGRRRAPWVVTPPASRPTTP